MGGYVISGCWFLVGALPTKVNNTNKGTEMDDIEKTKLEYKQTLLAELLKGGAFRFDSAIATVSYQEYKDIITSLNPPQDYSIGYDLGGINYLENCYLDTDEHNTVELVRRERTWKNSTLRAFQLELITVPKLIMVTVEPNEPNTLSTIWYCDKNGNVVAYIQTYNDVIMEDIRV